MYIYNYIYIFHCFSIPSCTGELQLRFARSAYQPCNAKRLPRSWRRAAFAFQFGIPRAWKCTDFIAPHHYLCWRSIYPLKSKVWTHEKRQQVESQRVFGAVGCILRVYSRTSRSTKTQSASAAPGIDGSKLHQNGVNRRYLCPEETLGLFMGHRTRLSSISSTNFTKKLLSPLWNHLVGWVTPL